MKRKTIPAKLFRETIREMGYHCPFCLRELSTQTLIYTGRAEMAHLEPYANTLQHLPHNLARICPLHHEFWDKVVSNPALFKADLREFNRNRQPLCLSQVRDFIARCWAEHVNQPSQLLTSLWTLLRDHTIANDDAMLNVLACEAEALRLRGFLGPAIDLVTLIDRIRWKRRPNYLQVQLLMTKARVLTSLGAPGASVSLIRHAFNLTKAEPNYFPPLLVIFANSLSAAGAKWPIINGHLQQFAWNSPDLRKDKPGLVGILQMISVQGHILRLDWHAAENALCEARRLLEASAVSRSEGMCLGNLARMYYRAGKFERSASTMDEAAEYYRRAEDSWGLGTALAGKADALLAQAILAKSNCEARASAALDRYEAANRLWNYDQHFRPKVCERKAKAHLLLDNKSEARQLLKEANEIRKGRTARVGGAQVTVSDDKLYLQALPTRR